jgi:hypothetical protein
MGFLSLAHLFGSSLSRLSGFLRLGCSHVNHCNLVIGYRPAGMWHDSTASIPCQNFPSASWGARNHDQRASPIASCIHLAPRVVLTKRNGAPMRLLSSKEWMMKEFIDERSLPPYSILSHKWYPNGEFTLQHWNDIPFEELEFMQGWKKVQYCREQAAKDGIDWVWVDT